MPRKNTHISVNQIVIGLSMELMTLIAQAAMPLWTFSPFTPTNREIPADGTAKAAYVITNNSHKPKNLVIQPQAGIKQEAPCTLAPAGQPGSTCLLRLTLIGSQVPANGIHGGPTLCQANSTGNPNPNQCYRPAASNVLNITTKVPIIVSPTNLTFSVNSGGGTITIQQEKHEATLSNIKAKIPAGSALTVTNNCPEKLEFGATCTMNFQSQTPEGPIPVIISGDNSTVATINVTVTSPQTASLSFSNTTIYNVVTQGILTEERGVNETECNQNNSVWDSANKLCLSKSRNLLIINNGPDVAKNVTYTISPPLPAGTTITPASCGDIVLNGICTLTVTPGSTPTGSPGTQPAPSIITVSGINTPTPASAQITVLTYGNIYQGRGYLFAIDDAENFMGGKITALDDQNQGTRWGTNVVIEGIDQTSEPPLSCSGATDGSCNTSRIIKANLPPPFAALYCEYYSPDLREWYLPAICEMGYDTFSAGTGCGNVTAPTLQNMQSNLSEYNNMYLLGNGKSYWSSTQLAAAPRNNVWGQAFGAVDNNLQFFGDKSFRGINTRCVRTL